MQNRANIREELLSRRAFLGSVPAAGITSGLLWGLGVSQSRGEDVPVAGAKPYPEFPQADPKLAQEMVGVCHFNEARVKELADIKPELVNATWDWGYGDWETALGAAAHTGRRTIAEFLIQRGARIDIFAAAMLGMTEVVKGMVTALPGIQKALGPHGITLLAHARAGGEQAKETLAYLESLGDADQKTPTQALSAVEQDIYLGKYPFGPGAEDRVVVKLNDRGEMQIVVGRYAGRPLHFVGNHEFFPAGAPSVRIRFEVESGKAKSVTFVERAPVFTAQRKDG